MVEHSKEEAEAGAQGWVPCSRCADWDLLQSSWSLLGWGAGPMLLCWLRFQSGSAELLLLSLDMCPGLCFLGFFIIFFFPFGQSFFKASYQTLSMLSSKCSQALHAFRFCSWVSSLKGVLDQSMRVMDVRHGDAEDVMGVQHFALLAPHAAGFQSKQPGKNMEKDDGGWRSTL